jgi:hypothetical protein
VYRAIGAPSSPLASTPGRVVEPVSDRLTLLLPEQGEVVGTARVEPDNQGRKVLANWSNPADWIKWKAKVPAPGIYNVTVEYSCASPKPAATVEVAVGFQGVQAQLEPTGNWENTCRQFFGQVQIFRSDGIPVNVNVIEKHSPWIMKLHSVRLVRTDDTKLSEPPKAAHRQQ